MIATVGATPTLTWQHRDPLTGEPLDPATVTATLTGPDRPATMLAVTRVTAGDYTVTPTLDTSGDWLIAWTSTGPDENDEVGVYAVPEPSAAGWAPTLRDVAIRIQSRTRQVDTDNEPAGTFNDTTYPTGDGVQLLIESAVSVVAGYLGTPIKPAAYRLASTAAVLWAAYWVELSFPERDADVAIYQQLRVDADTFTKQAVAVNLGAGGGMDGQPDTNGTPDVLPQYSFPLAPRYGDRLYW